MKNILIVGHRLSEKNLAIKAKALKISLYDKSSTVKNMIAFIDKELKEA